MKGVGLGALTPDRQARGDLIQLGAGSSWIHVQPDNGCELAPKCTECPLERCRYDTPGGMTTVQRQQLDARLIALRRQGLSLRAIAQAESVARRTAQRALRRNGL